MRADGTLEAHELVKYYGSKRALDGVSLSLKKGEIHVLLGRNGSGKTTLAKMLAGILRPDAGDICADGIKNGACDSSFRKNVGLLFDTSSHWDRLTGRENAWFFAKAFGLGESECAKRIDLLFDQLSLTEVANDQVSTYSFGMKRKLALVQALLHDPRILILDEPSIGLDYASRITIYTMLRAHALRGLSVLIATNDMNEARHLADRVSLIDKGRILVTGSPVDLIKELDQRVMIEISLKVPVRAEDVVRLPNVLGATFRDGRDSTTLEVMAPNDCEQKVIGELLEFLSRNNAGFTKMDVRRPELGDVFLKYVGG